MLFTVQKVLQTNVKSVKYHSLEMSYCKTCSSYRVAPAGYASFAVASWGGRHSSHPWTATRVFAYLSETWCWGCRVNSAHHLSRMSTLHRFYLSPLNSLKQNACLNRVVVEKNCLQIKHDLLKVKPIEQYQQIHNLIISFCVKLIFIGHPQHRVIMLRAV